MLTIFASNINTENKYAFQWEFKSSYYAKLCFKLKQANLVSNLPTPHTTS